MVTVQKADDTHIPKKNGAEGPFSCRSDRRRWKSMDKVANMATAMVVVMYRAISGIRGGIRRCRQDRYTMTFIPEGQR